MKQPITTILATLTRYWTTAMFINNINQLKCDPGRTELVLIIDNSDERIAKLISDNLHRKGYRNLIVEFNDHIPDDKSVRVRRDRIAEVMNQAKGLIGDTEFVFGLEDDTTFPHRTMEKFLRFAGNTKDFGFITGIQVGRHGFPHVGAWKTDNYSDPKKIWSIPRFRGITNIDAGGFFCFLTPTSLFKSVDHSWKEPLGPDVNYGLIIKRRGFLCFADWDIECGHMTILSPSDRSIRTLGFAKNDNKWSKIS